MKDDFGKPRQSNPQSKMPTEEELAEWMKGFEEEERKRAAIPPEKRYINRNPKFNKGFGPVVPENELQPNELREYYKSEGYDPDTGEKRR